MQCLQLYFDLLTNAIRRTDEISRKTVVKIIRAYEQVGRIIEGSPYSQIQRERITSLQELIG